MACLKIAPRPYLNHDALDCLIHKYVFPRAKLIGGLAVDPAHAAEHMHLVKELWFQSGGRQLRHFILCLNEQESSHIYHAGSLMVGAYEICEFYSDEYQIVFGVHQKSEKWHIHFVMNTVSYVNGKRYIDRNIQDYILKNSILTCTLPIQRINIYYE